MIQWKRVLRTMTSERFVGTREGKDAAAVDLHYLPSGAVEGSAFLFPGFNWDETHIQEVLRSLDEEMLPDVDLASGSLSYTVVRGEVLGTFTAQKPIGQA